MTRRRTGAETKAEAQRVALELFSTQGYDATSLRQIAASLGINKASLYYHFTSKEEIVRSTFADRGSEAHELLDWARRQPPAPDLLRRTVLRWVDSFSVDKLRGIAFVTANPALIRGIGPELGAEITAGLESLVAFLAGPGSGPPRILLVRMALLSINAAAAAAAGTDLSDEAVVAAARENALALLERL